MNGASVRRVLVVNKYHFVSGGAERYFLSIMESLRRRSIEAVPLSVRYPQTLPTPYERFFIPPAGPDAQAKIQNQRLGWTQRVRTAARAVYSTAAKKALRRIARESRPDVAYLLNINNHISPSVIDACREENIPVVMRLSDFNLVCASNMYYRDGAPCTECRHGLHHAIQHRCVHGSRIRSAVSVFANSLHRALGIYKRVDAFVTPTQFMAGELRALGFAEEKIHPIRTFAEPVGCSAADRADPYFVFIGRFVEYKGAEQALRAFAGLDGKSKVRFKLVGDEGDAGSLKIRALVRELELTRVDVLPFERDKKRLSEIVQKALFVAAPSQFYENLPNSVLEAYACGKPVLSTRIGSIPETVEEGRTGLLAELGDVEDLRNKMRRLVEDPDETEAMGRRAYETLLRDYSESAHVEKLLGVFEKVVAARGHKAAA